MIGKKTLILQLNVQTRERASHYRRFEESPVKLNFVSEMGVQADEYVKSIVEKGNFS